MLIISNKRILLTSALVITTTTKQMLQNILRSGRENLMLLDVEIHQIHNLKR